MMGNDSTRIRNTMPAHNTYRKAAFQMKITAILLMLLALFSPTTPAQDYSQLNLPEGAVARLGKGRLAEIQYSPDGALGLQLPASIGIWLYDTTTNREVALLTGHTARVVSVAFSTDGKMLASGSYDGTMLLWKVAD